jgi:hypothetical protein
MRLCCGVGTGAATAEISLSRQSCWVGSWAARATVTSRFLQWRTTTAVVVY